MSIYTHPDKVTPVTRHISDADRMEWLDKNCYYFEHHKVVLRDGYWPHTGEAPVDVEAYINLTLREYIDARINGGLT